MHCFFFSFFKFFWFYLVLSGSRRLFSISFRGWVSGASWRQAKATMRLWRVAPNPAEFIRICMRICRICTLNFAMLWHKQEIRVNNVQQTHIQKININDMIDYFKLLIEVFFLSSFTFHSFEITVSCQHISGNGWSPKSPKVRMEWVLWDLWWPDSPLAVRNWASNWPPITEHCAL